MPALRMRPRRSLARLVAVNKSPAPPLGLPFAHSPQTRVGFTIATVMICFFCIYLFSAFTEEPPPLRPRRNGKPAKTTTSQKRNHLVRRIVRPLGHGLSIGGRSSVSSVPIPAISKADPKSKERRQYVRALVRKVMKILPEVKKHKANLGTFYSRFAVFKEFYEGLPESDRLAIFPEVDPAALEEFFKEHPDRACALIDRLLLRTRILMI